MGDNNAALDYFGTKRDNVSVLMRWFDAIKARQPESWHAFFVIRQGLAESLDQNPETLRKAVRSEETAVKAAGMTVLGRKQTPEIIAALEGASKSPDVFVACSALEALGSTGERAVTPRLVRALKDPLAQKRAVAAYALSMLEDEAAIDALTSALDDVETRVQKVAAFALMKIRAKQVLEKRAPKEAAEEALKKFFSYLEVGKLAEVAAGKKSDIKIDATDIYPGPVPGEVLKLIFRRFHVVVRAHKKSFLGEKKEVFAYLVDAENADDAKGRVVEQFTRKQVNEGFVLDGVGEPADLTAIGADVSKQYILGLLMRPIPSKP